MDSDGPLQDFTGGANESSFISTVPEGEANGRIKGRASINGAPQQAYIPKEEAASPTVSTESTFITASIAAHEHRKVRCYDVPSAFVNTEVDEDVSMVLKGKLAEMMVQIAPQVYRKYVTVDRKGMPFLYFKLQKALYGLMRASLLFYRKLQKELEEYGFEVNPYDPCVANNMTDNGIQVTLVWHVNDLMGSCEDDFGLTKLACYLVKIYARLIITAFQHYCFQCQIHSIPGYYSSVFRSNLFKLSSC
jgi:hypothetical protein